MEFTLEQIAKILGGEIVGNKKEKVSNLSKIEEAKAGTITFLANPKYEQYIYETEASAVIVKNDFSPKKALNVSLIKVEDPYMSFTLLLEEYIKLRRSHKTGIEEPSFIAPSATLGEQTYIGAFTYVGNNARIGNNVKIFPQCFIGDNVTIGNDSVIYAGVKIYADTKIGDRCVIHSGSVLGSDGFGFAPQQDGTYRAIPQMGHVILEDDVDVGANTVIDRATLGATIIEKGVKLDNLIQIAHNVEIGANTVIAAQSGISGSTKIGKGCVIAGQVGVVGHLEIADRVTLAAKTGLSKSVKEPGSIKFGYPALDHKEYLKCNAVFRNLPELNIRVKQLEEKIVNLRPE